MFGFFTRHNKHADTNKETGYTFVENYVLIQPEKLLIDYSLFKSSKTIPVAYEQESNTGWNNTISLPNEQQIRIFLKQLRDADSEAIKDVKYRTVSVVKLGEGKNIYIVPNLKHKNKPAMVVHFEKQDKYPWPYYVTPEINKAIVEQLKVYTR